METIKFATEWQEHLSGKGVRKRITAFYRMAFMRDSDFSYHFEGLTESAVESKLKELTSEYNQWRNKIGRVVTARNRLLRLYDMVGCLPFIFPVTSIKISSLALQSFLIRSGTSTNSSMVALGSSSRSGTPCTHIYDKTKTVSRRRDGRRKPSSAS